MHINKLPATYGLKGSSTLQILFAVYHAHSFRVVVWYTIDQHRKWVYTGLFRQRIRYKCKGRAGLRDVLALAIKRVAILLTLAGFGKSANIDIVIDRNLGFISLGVSF